jgi:hypothetical protein
MAASRCLVGEEIIKYNSSLDISSGAKNSVLLSRYNWIPAAQHTSRVISVSSYMVPTWKTDWLLDYMCK